MSQWGLYVLIAVFTGTCLGQESGGSPSSLIDVRKPSAYFTYTKSETLKSKYGNVADVIWLELKNNTRWRIWSVGLPDQYGGSGWCYLVATDDSCHTPVYPLITNCGDVLGPIEIAPGQSIPVAVLREELSRGLAIETTFSYDWERAGGISHAISFGNSDLPPNVRDGTRFVDTIPRPQSACTDAIRLRPMPEVTLPSPPVPDLKELLKPSPAAPPPLKKN